MIVNEHDAGLYHQVTNGANVDSCRGHRRAEIPELYIATVRWDAETSFRASFESIVSSRAWEEWGKRFSHI
jgi:hypothetical protein